MGDGLPTRDNLVEWAVRSFGLKPMARAALMIGIQALPDPLFAELAETIADISAEMGPGDSDHLDRIFHTREGRRDLVRAIIDYARTH